MKNIVAELDLTENWDKILNLLNDGLMIVAPNGAIRFINRALENLLGYKRSEMIGKPCLMLDCDACEPLVSKTRKAWCTLFDKGKELQKDCLMVKKDGSYAPVIKKASLLYNSTGEILGALEIFTDVSNLRKLDNELKRLSRRLYGNKGFQGIIGQTSSVKKMLSVVEKAADSDAPVIILGESGTGKELVAQAIHNLSKRRHGPFVKVNSAALNQALLESELFGHIKGAFTGAYRHRMGRFEYADGGNLFLDEIGDLPHSVQVKLLRVLESKKIERVGDQEPIGVDVRIISATNKNLKELIEKGKFREDLFYRINVIPINLPPLRERMDDVPLLVKSFVEQMQMLTKKEITGLTAEAMHLLMTYRWPGNVRELKAALEYAFVIKDSGLIGPPDLPGYVHENADVDICHALPNSGIECEEKTALIEALKKSMGNKSQAARILGISRGTVWNRMRKYGINPKKILFS
jgi:PAS domain S-box-containing protein